MHITGMVLTHPDLSGQMNYLTEVFAEFAGATFDDVEGVSLDRQRDSNTSTTLIMIDQAQPSGATVQHSLQQGLQSIFDLDFMIRFGRYDHLVLAADYASALDARLNRRKKNLSLV